MTPTVDDPLPDLIRSLRGSVPDARCRAARSLGKLGWLARDALPLLVHCLNDSEPSVREAAAQAVGQMGPDALPHLRTMLMHSDKYVRRNAVWALGKLGPVAKSAVPALCQALKDADPRTASGAAQTLGTMATDATESIPALAEAMRGTNIVLCRLAAKALSEIGRAALPTLIAHLKDRDPFVRGEAALALGWMGPAAAAAVPTLVDVLAIQPAASVSSNIPGTLTTPPTIVAPPPPAPTTPDASRAHAAQALGRIGPAATDALPILTQALTDDHDVVREAALQAIRQIRG